MDNHQEVKLNDFFKKLATLYLDVANWVHLKNLKVERDTIELNEEAFGKYTVEKCSVVNSDGKRIAELLPVGASIIGAKYRVDLIGLIDQEILVYYDEGGPRMKGGVFVGDRIDTNEMSTFKIYRGVDEAGWYWIESQRLSRAYKVDQKLFLELLSTVSDYEYQP
jgi:hypothetical protein